MVDDTESCVENFKFNQFTTVDTIQVKRHYKRCSEEKRAIPNKTYQKNLYFPNNMPQV